MLSFLSDRYEEGELGVELKLTALQNQCWKVMIDLQCLLSTGLFFWMMCSDRIHTMV